MACPTPVTYCPLCLEPLSAVECDTSPVNEYPTHYVCRVALQERMEAIWERDDEAEYRGLELDRLQDRAGEDDS